MNSGLKKQMEIFIAKADRYVQIASHIHACRLTIENAKYCESPKLPPDNELVKKIAEETIFPRCLNYLRSGYHQKDFFLY